MSFDTLSGRIFATLAAVIVALLGAAWVFGEIRIRSFHRDELETRLANVSDLLVEPATEVLAGRGDRERFMTRIVDLGHATHLRFTLTDADGRVLADSDAPLPLESHADRPEIKQSFSSGTGVSERRSTTTGREMTYFAHRIDDPAGRALGAVRVAAEKSEVERAIGTLRKSLLFGALLALGLGLAASAILARRLASPLEEIGRGAAAVVDGATFDGNIPVLGPLEVRRLAGVLNTMAGELRQRIETTRRARIEIETILASMAEGVVAVDARERVLLMNQAAADLLGLEAPLAAGAALWEHLRFPELERALRGVLERQEVSHTDALSPRQAGTTLTVSAAPVGTATPREPPTFMGAVALLSDVTAIRKLEQVRIDFVANVSHELRTPLAAVMGALETLALPAQDQETRLRFLDIANRNAQRLKAIVSDLLDLSSIEAEGDKMALEPARIFVPLKAAATALSGAAEAKGVQLELAPPPHPPIMVNANHQRLEQVFTNLLENAIKYTPPGGSVRVAIHSTPSEVSVAVIDTGVGIPAASLSRVFERFYRVDRSRSREMGGTGLGLAIVKHVLRAHGGQVEVESEEGVGSTFTITLPRAGSSSERTATQQRRDD